MLGISFFKDGSGLPPQGRDRAVPLALPPGEGHPLTMVAPFGGLPGFVSSGGTTHQTPRVGFAHRALPTGRSGDAPRPPGVGFAHRAFWWFPRLIQGVPVVCAHDPGRSGFCTWRFCA